MRGGKRRLVPRLAPEPLERIEQRRLLATDVGTGPAAQRDVEATSRAGDVVAQEPCGPGLGDGMAQTVGGHRVLTPDVQPALLGPDGQAGHRHSLDEGERVTLHDNPVLKGSGLRLIGIAHQVAGTPLLVGHAAPLDAGREGSTAPTGQPGRGHLGNHLVRSHGQRGLQGPVAAVGPVVLEAGRIDDTDTGQEA